MPQFLRSWAIVLTAAGVACAQFSGPVEGVVFDPPSRTIRAVLGTPNAARLGDALSSNLDYASVAPSHRHAILFRDGHVLTVSGFDAEAPAETQLAESAVPEGVAWSSDSSTAVFFSRSEGWLQAVRGLPAEPFLGPRFETGNRIAGIAVGRDGANIVVLVEHEQPSLLRLGPDMEQLPLPGVEHASAIEFDDAGRLLVANESLVSIDLDSQAAEEWIHTDEKILSIAWMPDRLSPKAALLLSGGKVQIVDARTREIVVTIETGIEAQALRRLGKSSVVVGDREPDSPLWLVSRSPEWSAVFVPAAPLAHDTAEDRP